jgi:tol-pal system protein YbgF
MTNKAPLILAALALTTAGCFASKSDFERLQQDVGIVRSSSASADSAQRIQMIELSRSIRALNDSMSALNIKLLTMTTAAESERNDIRQDVVQLRDLSGQSEQRLREMRATLEEKATEPVPVAPTGSTAVGTPPAPPAAGPGPAQLLQAGRDQLLKGGNVAARSAFADLLARYPNSELAPDAVFYTAQAYAAAHDNSAADSVYAVLIARYPKSPRVPTAMYKRALQMQASKKTVEARRMFQDIIKRFPRSDEAALAGERLQSIR